MRLAALALLALLVGHSANAGFGLHIGGHFEGGNFGGDSNGEFATKSIGAIDLQAMPGYRFLGDIVLVGLMLEGRFVTHLAEKSEREWGGKSFTYGPAFSVEAPFLKLLLGWDVYARHNTSTPSATYKGSGWRILLGYRLAATWWTDLQYSTVTYDSRTEGEASADMSLAPVKSSTMAFGISWAF